MKLAVVALGVRAAGGTGTDDFVRHLLDNGPSATALPGGGEGFPAGLLTMSPAQLRVPPQDLAVGLGQQTLLMLASLWEERGLLAPGELLEYTCWHVRHSVEAIRQAISAEPRVRITTIFAPDECCINGQAADCNGVLDGLKARARRVEFDVAAHCPEVTPSAEIWRRLSHRPTRPVPGVRFYTNADNNWYEPSADAAADAYTRQALATIDFTRTVEQAWHDGVRIFVEHGPRGMLSGCIGRILGERDHLAVALDLAGHSPIRQIFEASARLWSVGVPLNLDRLLAAAARLRRPVLLPRTGSSLTLPTRLPEVHFPAHLNAPSTAKAEMPVAT